MNTEKKNVDWCGPGTPLSLWPTSNPPHILSSTFLHPLSLPCPQQPVLLGFLHASRQASGQNMNLRVLIGIETNIFTILTHLPFLMYCICQLQSCRNGPSRHNLLGWIKKKNLSVIGSYVWSSSSKWNWAWAYLRSHPWWPGCCGFLQGSGWFELVWSDSRLGNDLRDKELTYRQV